MTKLSYPVSEGVSAADQLDFLSSVLGLNETELGRLFGVRRQAVSQWRVRGIPPNRTAQVDRIVGLTQFLQRRIIPQRIPQIVRTLAEQLDGKTMLDVIRDDGPDRFYHYLYGLSAYPNT